MKIGDKIKLKHNSSLVWIIKEEDNVLYKTRLESLDGGVTQWVKQYQLITEYVMVEEAEKSPQLNFYNSWSGTYDNELPKGKEDNKPYCYHNYQKYYGLKENYEFCTKCDEKREIQE
jgi:hypothetical protein